MSAPSDGSQPGRHPGDTPTPGWQPPPSGYAPSGSAPDGGSGQNAGDPGREQPSWGSPVGQPGQGQPGAPVPWGQQYPGHPAHQGQPHWPSGPGAFHASGGLGVAVVVLSTLVTAVYWLSALLAPSADRSYEGAIAEGRSTMDVFTAYDAIGALSLPVLIAAWVVTSLWLGRARENALRLSPDGQRRSAVWVWLGWVVPIVSLWFPKQILDDTTKATAPAVGRPPIATGWYWAAWVVTNVLSNVLLRWSVGAEPRDAVQPGIEFAVAIAATVALVLWIRVVRRLSADQDQLAAQGPDPARMPSPAPA